MISEEEEQRALVKALGGLRTSLAHGKEVRGFSPDFEGGIALALGKIRRRSLSTAAHERKDRQTATPVSLEVDTNGTAGDSSKDEEVRREGSDSWIDTESESSHVDNDDGSLVSTTFDRIG